MRQYRAGDTPGPPATPFGRVTPMSPLGTHLASFSAWSDYSGTMDHDDPYFEELTWPFDGVGRYLIAIVALLVCSGTLAVGILSLISIAGSAP
jgi:hypothetical protein